MGLEDLFALNGVDLDLFEPDSTDRSIRPRYGWGDKFVIVDPGAHDRANHLIQYVKTTKLLRDWSVKLLVCVADGAQREVVKEATRRRNLQNIHWIDFVPKTDMVDFLLAVDAGTTILIYEDAFKFVYPKKIFDYMSVKLPVLCTNDGIGCELVEEDDAGVKSNQPEYFAKHLCIGRSSGQRATDDGPTSPPGCRNPRRHRKVRCQISHRPEGTQYHPLIVGTYEFHPPRNRYT